MPISTTTSQTVTSDTTTTTSSTTTTDLAPLAIIDLILSDVNAVLPNFNSLVSSYRLLVGAAEEINRTPNVCPDVFERAVRRYDNAGMLLDVLLELLCCKIVFSSELLRVTCGPVDLVRYLVTCLDGQDIPCRTAEEVVGLAALRRLQDNLCGDHYCLPDRPVVCPKPPVTPTPPASTPPSSDDEDQTALPVDNDIAEVVETKIISNLTQPGFLSNPLPNEVTAQNGETVQPSTAAIAAAIAAKASEENEAVLNELKTETHMPRPSRVRLKNIDDPYGQPRKSNRDKKNK
ncbi:hypothetical protein EV210_11553 [Anaerospora hongkongensis]|uniref:Uncharacterized protein n=1 Tax=Anaerospora hongkongensis TaxID=244830 RepID=A0A4R1PW11_9FIRM|nr:hypothetical protein [Anaerospora hongkongensis]TCL34468.1 hypothetical protein EV210_11553 [Anaerospora hongkongensis]